MNSAFRLLNARNIAHFYYVKYSLSNKTLMYSTDLKKKKLHKLFPRLSLTPRVKDKYSLNGNSKYTLFIPIDTYRTANKKNPERGKMSFHQFLKLKARK